MHVGGPGNGGDVLPDGVGARLGDGVDLVGVIGAGPMWDDESSLGLGGMTGAGIGYRFPGGLSVELLVDRRYHDRRFRSDVRFSAHAGRTSGRLLYYFPGARVRAYVGGTVGAMRVEQRSEFPGQCGFDAGGQFSCPAVSTFEREISNGSFGAVTGVRISLTDRVFVRPEFEFAKAGEFITLGGAVGVGWGW
jgi:opacity protein-like surface antigen